MKHLAGPTRVARSGHPGALTSALLDKLLAREDEYLADPRELMLTLAPYHHVARWLGEDPSELFDTVASGAPATLRDAVRTFGRRDDIEPDKFGFAVVETAEGPEYFRTL
ncbi:hypothetical protein DVA67_011700 [Solirubrobacter sp. CPCC 204708]|uniref:Uncharacterized protein n=1 Tax=Solirubrobacter deserti TaxID=2282478 RepID=A0ABT4RPQ1_9ACTN|nr:hypothetical protein [Solirubrobacter deserti]MBE2316644.1 hypothetical protein [Solirubrobacter deserti]MDA0140542.1 hypothetical protein [Solirubrobacter deserti]